MLPRFQDQRASGYDQNNFNNVRVCLALIVFFSHALGLPNNSALAYYYQFFNAPYAVKGFFAISGFLVYRSYVNSNNLVDFFDKRIRRIYPAYLLTILSCFLIGLLFGDLGWKEFIFSDHAISYLLSNIFFLNFLQPTLPGLFIGNATQIVDGSLWTIKVELMLYAILPMLAYGFKKMSPFWSYFCVLIFGAAWVFYFSRSTNIALGAEIARQFPGQLPYFAFGCLLAATPRLMKWLPFVSIVGFIMMTYSGSYSYFIGLTIEPITYGAVTILFCMLKPFKLNIGKIGDLSYGIYLFHFPIIQLLIHLKVYQFNPYIGLVMSFVITILASFISWHYVESRWLKRNSYYLAATSG